MPCVQQKTGGGEMNKLESALVIAFMIFCVIVAIGVYSQYKECTSGGGVLVRGLFGYECIR